MGQIHPLGIPCYSQLSSRYLYVTDLVQSCCWSGYNYVVRYRERSFGNERNISKIMLCISHVHVRFVSQMTESVLIHVVQRSAVQAPVLNPRLLWNLPSWIVSHQLLKASSPCTRTDSTGCSHTARQSTLQESLVRELRITINWLVQIPIRTLK